MNEQFKTWSWVKAYQVGERLFDKIALEDTFPKDKPDDECIDELEQRITAQAKRKYPHLFDGNGFVWHELKPHGWELEQPIPKEVQIEKSEPKEKLFVDWENDILNCNKLTGKDGLESFGFLVKQHPGLQLAYNQKLKELNANKEQVSTM